MPLITLEGVGYRYPEAERPALVDVSAAIEPGQVILLRGPSCCGGARTRCASPRAWPVPPRARSAAEPPPRPARRGAGAVLRVGVGLAAELGRTTVTAEHRGDRTAPRVDRIWPLDAGVRKDQPP